MEIDNKEVICIIEDDVKKFDDLIKEHKAKGYEIKGPMRFSEGTCYAVMSLKPVVKPREKPTYIKMKNFLIDYYLESSFRPLSREAEYEFKSNTDGTSANLTVWEDFARGRDALVMLSYSSDIGYTLWGPLPNGDLGRVKVFDNI